MPKGVYERKPRSAETRAKISAALAGRPKSAETRARMSAAKMGHEPSIGQWKGEGIHYSGAHYRAGLVLPMECAHADGSCLGVLDIAFRHADAPAALVRDDDPRGRYYAGDPLDGYMRLCRSHHRRYDRALPPGH
ncbi:MAG TPA: NUMOD3 domain-containing DNA-binding protein [Streptosporangiaceae bacterium]|nr:NUMOD3 domain-containing DNA-binding protein [Streptosporangiaceae bacterium]